MNLITSIAGELTQFVNLLSFMTLALIALGVQVFFRSHLKPEVVQEDELFVQQMNLREHRLRDRVRAVEQQRAQQQDELHQVLSEVRRLNVVRNQLQSNQQQLRAQLDLAMRKGDGQQHVIRQLLGKSQQIDHMQALLRKRDALIHFMLKQKKAERLATLRESQLTETKAQTRVESHTRQVNHTQASQIRKQGAKRQTPYSGSNVALLPVDYKRPDHNQPQTQPRAHPVVNLNEAKSTKRSKQVCSRRFKVLGRTLFSRRQSRRPDHPAELIPVRAVSSQPEKQLQVANR